MSRKRRLKIQYEFHPLFFGFGIGYVRDEHAFALLLPMFFIQVSWKRPHYHRFDRY